MSTTVTIEKSYLDALLLRADVHTSVRDSRFPPDLSNDIVISKTEHDRLLQASREYNTLKNALFRGGLTTETLQTLLEEEDGATTIGESQNKPALTDARRRTSFQWASGSGRHESVGSMKDDRNDARGFSESNPGHDRRTILITNLPEGTTHKELTSIICGGRLLDVFLYNNRSAQVSFVEGASNFLAYVKRHDIYLHSKRLDFRWADRQFHVPNHISNKIAGGASRNLVIRSGATKFSPKDIRNHLEHIHNLVVIDVYPLEGDLYVSTNSIHNAMFAKTCMMSRSLYKGVRVEFHPDECAARLPLPPIKPRAPEIPAKVSKNLATANIYALLDTESDLESASEDNFSITEGICIDRHHRSEAAVA